MAMIDWDLRGERLQPIPLAAGDTTAAKALAELLLATYSAFQQ